MKTILKLTVILVIFAGFFSCEKDDKPIYLLCENQQEIYIDNYKLNGNGYLFLNSIPIDMESRNNVAYVVYFPEQDSTVFKFTNNKATYNAEVCNFPDYAKHWNIPLLGKRFSFKGEFYEEGQYLSVPPYVGGKMVLTVFKSK